MGGRTTSWQRLGAERFDVVVVGAGITGASSASALANAGYKVALVDAGDFASATSQSSSNLVWGGIKYLEGHEYGLVWHLCAARNRLMKAFPSQVKQTRFVAAPEIGFRWSPLALWLGAWVYWLFGRAATAVPRLIRPNRLATEFPALAGKAVRGAAAYYDARLATADARFVLGFVHQAESQGTVVRNYTRLEHARRTEFGWALGLCDVASGVCTEVSAKWVVNATGPYVDDVNRLLGASTEHEIVRSRGSHIIVPQIDTGGAVIALFDEDGRLFFVIPFGGATAIGTTDIRVDNVPEKMPPEDRAFLLRNANRRLTLSAPLTEADIVAERCGVRPLVRSKRDASRNDGDWFRLSRKHVIEVGDQSVSIFGGKLTDCLNIGDEMRAQMRSLIAPSGAATDEPWFGEPSQEEARAFHERAQGMSLSRDLVDHLWRRYGRRGYLLLNQIDADPIAAQPLVPEFPWIQAEVSHAIDYEWATCWDDFARRRTELAQTVEQKLIEASGVMEVWNRAATVSR